MIGPMPCVGCRRNLWWDGALVRFVEATGQRHVCPAPAREVVARSAPAPRPRSEFFLRHSAYATGRREAR